MFYLNTKQKNKTSGNAKKTKKIAINDLSFGVYPYGSISTELSLVNPYISLQSSMKISW